MPTNLEKAGRDIAIDIARGLGMILVLYAHALEMSLSEKTRVLTTAFEQWQFIYSFHMPMFFFISGMLFRLKSTRHVIMTSLTLLFISYLSHIIGWIIIFILYKPIATADTLFMPILTQQRFSIIVTWFLAALAIVQIIYHFLLKSGLFMRVVISCAVACLFYVSQATENTSFQIGALFPGLIFYAIGHWWTQGKITEITDQFNPALVVIFVVACLTLAPLNGGCTFNPLDNCPNKIGKFGVLMATGQVGFIPIFIITALAGSFFVLSLSKKIEKIPGVISSFLFWIGNNTLDLLIINGFVFVFLQPRLQQQISSHSLDNPIAWAVGLTAIQLIFLPLALPATRTIRNMAEFLSKKFYLVFLIKILEQKSAEI